MERHISEIDRNMKMEKAESGELVFRSAKDPAFGIYGSDALGEKGFCRLTERERALLRPVNDGEAWLGEHSAGIGLRFETDSSRIFVRVALRSKFDMTNMTQIGQCGADLFVWDERMGAECLHEVARFGFDADRYEVPLGHFEGKERQMRRCRICLPLYMIVDSFEIGLDANAVVRPIAFSDGTRYGIYGTSITQGCSASHPGMAYSNLLSAALDAEVLNFGFSGSAFMEREMAEILGSRSLDVLIVDTEPNAGTDLCLMERAEEFLKTFWEKSPDTAVVLYSRVLFALDLYDEERARLHERYNVFLKQLAAAWRRRNKAAFFADGTHIFPGNFTIYTADGVHPNDAGMMAIAADYARTLARIRKNLAAREKCL